MTLPENVIAFPTLRQIDQSSSPSMARVAQLCSDFETLLAENPETALSADFSLSRSQSPISESPLYRLNEFLEGYAQSKSSNRSLFEREVSWVAIRHSLDQKIKLFQAETFRGLVVYAIALASRTYPDLPRALAIKLNVADDTFKVFQNDGKSSKAINHALAYDVIAIESIDRFVRFSDEAQMLLIEQFRKSAGGQADVFRVESCMNYLTEQLQKSGNDKMDSLSPAEQQNILKYIKSRFGASS